MHVGQDCILGKEISYTNPTSPTEMDRRSSGIEVRKHLSRRSHGFFKANGNPSEALRLLQEAEKGRIPKLLHIKHQKMATSSFAFFRGAVPIMAADLAAHSNSGIEVQICGDAHVLNLGAYASFEGGLVFDINDFDETMRAPFEWDLKRLATSLLLAGRSVGIERSYRESAVERFTRRYRESMHAFPRMPMLELVRYQIHRMRSSPPIKSILNAAERSTPLRLLQKLTEEVNGVRRFKSNPPILERAC